jgi:hypothetical protein
MSQEREDVTYPRYTFWVTSANAFIDISNIASAC